MNARAFCSRTAEALGPSPSWAQGSANTHTSAHPSCPPALGRQMHPAPHGPREAAPEVPVGVPGALPGR